MPERFKGVINVDIRDSEPDWAPFEPPRAPDLWWEKQPSR